MSTVKNNKLLKQKNILDSAQEVFLTQGYSQANMDVIAAHAQVTKQTVYRYFSSKAVLFEATLREMGKRPEGNFFDHLAQADLSKALNDFAVDFIKFHTSAEHVAVYRLLIAESGKSPEVIEIFHGIGANDTKDKLMEFFEQQFPITDKSKIPMLMTMWTNMLLALRQQVLYCQKQPTIQQIKQHAEMATAMLLSYTKSNDK